MQHYLWTVLYCLSHVWFWLESVVFSLINRFRERKRVPPTDDDPILLVPAVEIARRIKKGLITSESVILAYVNRADRVDAQLNAIVQRNVENALKEAREIDETIQKALKSGTKNIDDIYPDMSLLGVPFTLKDCIWVDGLICTAGIPCRANTAAERDAKCVWRLRQQGAIPLFVTNVSEVCMWWESYNSIYGRTRNPYDLRRIVGGSSGGEAALISAGGSIFGIGSDIGGSLRMPAHFSGIYTHKPSPWIVSDDGNVPECHGYLRVMCQDGPMCRYVQDLKPMLKALAEPEQLKKLKLDEKISISDLKIFYFEEIYSPAIGGLDRHTRHALHKTIKYLENNFKGITIMRVDPPLMHYALSLWLNDTNEPQELTFAKQMLDGNGEVNVLKEFAKLPFGLSPHTLPALALAAFEQMGNRAHAETMHEEGLAARQALQKQLKDLLGDNGVLLMPTHPTIAPYHYQPLFQPFNFIYTAIINSLALCSTCVPLGLASRGTDRMPVSLQVVANEGNDRLTLFMAEVLDKGFGGWVDPGME